MNDYQPPLPPAREEPVTIFPPPSSPRRRSPNGLWVILTSIGMCLILLVALVVGTTSASSAYDEIQTSSVTQTMLAPGLPPAGWQPLLEEHFDDEDNGLWESNSWGFDTAFIRTFVEGGSYHWILDPTSDEGTVWLTGPDLSVPGDGSLYVAVDFWLTEGRESGMGYGLIYHYADDEHFYEFTILRNQVAGAYSRNDGKWIELLPSIRTNLLQAGVPNRIAVLMMGSHHVFYINDRYFAELDDDTIGSGGVGFSAEVYTGEEMSMQFDNFELYTP
jgi:hypothetical protein